MKILAVILFPFTTVAGRMMIPPRPWNGGRENSLETAQIQVEVFYESMCPDSKHFVETTLSSLLNDFSSYLSISMVPYGKGNTVQDGSKYKFTCQHGPDECTGNLYHNCAVKYIQDQTLQIKFLSCMFSNIFNVDADWRNWAKNCDEGLGLGAFPSIYNCAVDLEGKQLMSESGVRTGKRQFIPTVVLSTGGGRESAKIVLDTRSKVEKLRDQVCTLYLKLYGLVLPSCQSQHFA